MGVYYFLRLIGASSCFCSSRFPRDTLSQAGHGTVLESSPSPSFSDDSEPTRRLPRGPREVLERLAMMKSGSSVLRAIWVGREEGVVQVAEGRPASLFVPPEFLDLLPCWFPPRPRRRPPRHRGRPVLPRAVAPRSSLARPGDRGSVA